jgi:hypothetical protein
MMIKAATNAPARPRGMNSDFNLYDNLSQYLFNPGAKAGIESAVLDFIYYHDSILLFF